MSIAGVTRELLVRYLDTWTPGALHGRRATYVQSGATGTAESALRVFAEFADRLRGRHLSMVLVDRVPDRLTTLVRELDLPPELMVVAAPTVGAAVKAAGAAGAPLLGYLEDTSDVAAVAVGRPAEVLAAGPAGDWAARRSALRDAGFRLTAGVELVDGDQARLLAFGTSQQKSLEAYKNALWAVDEYAGVRYRDPGDPDGHLLDISLRPHPGPLRRELLAHLARVGAATVAELRAVTLTETVYRAQDTAGVLAALLSAKAVTRDPERGRLAGDVVIRPS